MLSTRFFLCAKCFQRLLPLLTLPKMRVATTLEKQASLNSLEKRFEYVKSSPKHIFATFCDPTKKLNITRSDNQFFNFNEEFCLQKCKEFIEQHLESEEIIDITQPTPSKHPRISLLDFDSTSADATTHTHKVWSQFLGFIFSPVTALSMSEHWSSIERNSLTRLLRNVLRCLPSEASVERFFNKAGDIQRAKRARISSENLQNLLVFRCNEEWNFFYTDIIISIEIAIAIANSEA